MKQLDTMPRVGMSIEPGRIPGVWRLEGQPRDDERGFFVETFRQSLVAPDLGRPYEFAQMNHSRSKARTLRGFRSEPWDKLIYVPRGTALIVAVDSRPDSPTFRQHQSYVIGDAPGTRDHILISRGVSNAFYCFTETDYLNSVSDEYAPSGRRGFTWNDSSLAIDWPDMSPILSEADRNLPSFEDFLTRA
ncbi:MAG: dTDP-4-dehydrorhamnose 3,5-epimerase family protein [Pseudomonadota bacterium]|nr:dTDP-4-dehydrorhamnose 3,5-epimerase family protein [Pseudomonadota bacterium]